LFFFTQIQIVFLFFCEEPTSNLFSQLYATIYYTHSVRNRLRIMKKNVVMALLYTAVQVRPNLTRALIKIEQPDHEIDKVIIAPAVNGSTAYNRKNCTLNFKIN
jgi:hypothetical protein